MELYLDSADITEIKEYVESGILDGITTNPSLIAASGEKFPTIIKNICQFIQKPVNVQVTGANCREMVNQGREYSKLDSKIIIKVPAVGEGIKAIKTLSSEGIPTNATLVFSPAQALLAAKAGARYISCFVARLEKIGINSYSTIEDMKMIFTNYGFKTKILAAPVTSVKHLTEMAKAGADVATMKPEVFRSLIYHPMTELGLKQFLADWMKVKQEK